MPDLQPDTSLYGVIANNANSGPLARMGLGDLLNLAQQSRALTTQSGIANAISANTQNGQTDYGAATQQAAQTPGVFLSPQETQAFTSANTAQTGLNLQLAKTGAQALKSLADMGPKVTPEAFTNIAPILSRINPRIIPMVSDALQSGDTGQALQARVIAISNAMGLPLPTTSVMGQSGVSSNVPTGAAAYSAYGVAPPTNGQGAAPGMGGASSAPGLPQNLPTGTPEYFASSADAGTKMLTNGPTLANNKAMLLTLDGLSNEAATGPTSGFEQRAGELAQRFGIALPFDAAAKTGKGMGQTSATEEYGKIAATLRQQMATTGFGFAGGHATDAFLNNSEEAMPNLNLSKLGRTGITHWLLGTNDAMQTMQKAWAQSGLAPQQFLGWMNGRVPGANGTFDINSFDPRVFQYARMTPQERTVFRSQMQPTAQAEFGAHLTDYTNRGWVTGPSTTNKVAGQ